MAPGPPVPQLPAADLKRPEYPATSREMTLVVTLALVAALYLARDVLIPLVLAVLLSIILSPLVGLLRRLRIGHVPAVLLAVIAALGIIFAIGGVIGSQVAEFADNVPTYAQTIEGKAGKLKSYADRQLNRAAGAIGYGAPSTQVPAAPSAPPNGRPAASDGSKPQTVSIDQPDLSPLKLAEQYVSPVLSPLSTIGIVFIVAIFVLLQKDDLHGRLIRLIGSHDLRRTTVALDEGARRLSRYFLTQLAINSGFGVCVGIGLFVIGVPSPLLWAFLSGLLRFVPYIGFLIAGLFPMAVAAAVDPGWSMMLWTGGLYLVLESIFGQILEPVLYGNSTGLSPLSVIVAAVFWSWLWGPIGLIISTPLTLCLVVLGRHVDRLEFLDIMLGDQPALTPVESFYQRMLAGDPDEARYHAEALLKDLSLTAYYDGVALPGAELAAIDAERGMLSIEQLERVKETIKELVDDLAVHLDKEPDESDAAGKDAKKDGRVPPDALLPRTLDPAAVPLSDIWRGPTPVLCVAGRGPLDEAAASMLCQLLSKHGIGASVAAYEAATRGNINLLKTEGVAMVCISYLDISGRQAHLRYLIQRLRQRLPTKPIVVGLWPSSDDLSMPDATMRTALGADYYTRTLREAVDICVGVATESGVAERESLAS